MQATQRAILVVVQFLSFLFSMDRQRFNETHASERNALAFLSPLVAEIPTINWIVGTLCWLYEATEKRSSRHWFWQFRSPSEWMDPAVARVRAVNTAMSIPIALLFVFINSTELYFNVLGTYPRDKSAGMLTVNLVLFLSAQRLDLIAARTRTPASPTHSLDKTE